MRSFSTLRTHTGLSTNVKVMVDSNYNLYLESISSVPDLDLDRFKKMQFNKSNYYDELVPYFFKNFPVDLAFSIKYDSDNDNMSVDFANQYDDIYLAGARNIIDNKNYTEEYEYFAPLYVFKHALPKYFIIFRVDGPGLVNMTKDNFRTEFLDKFKTVKIFDLTKNSLLGEWIDNNFRNNPNFPVTGLEIDFNELEFSKWNGIDYDSGGYTYKSYYLEENLENENNLFDSEKLFLDGYRVNKVIFPHIINFSYLFDDTPASPTSLRKWSLNRYCGFYLDELELIDTVTPFVMPELHSDVVVYSGNVIASTNYGDPFKNGWKSDVDMWVEYLGEFYKVIKFEETLDKAVTAQNFGTKAKKVLVDTVGKPVVTKYRIVTDLDLSGKQSLLNKRSCYINGQNQLVKTDGTPYVINNFTFADVNIIDIDGKYHNIFLENGYLTLTTDYGFKFQENNSFEYYINSGASGFSNKIDLFITNLNSPKNFKIYRAKFTDVKDFDTFIVDTEFSKFEYEKRNDLTKTEETKMYLTDLRSTTSPQDFDDFTFKGKTELVPVASDYTANLETFRIEDKKLTDLWRKNPIYCRWGYQNSRSAHDYPYLLNNNDVHEKWNRTVDTQNLKPKRSTRNLDYFYTINSGTTSYLHHSLHIEKNYGDVQDSSFKFELDKYLELGSYSFTSLSYGYTFSYFDLFFAPTQSFIDGELVLNKKKYSWFEQGDNVIPNTTVFRGLKFRLFEVDTIKYNSTFVENINLIPSNLFSDYKFSILLSSNDWMVNYGDSQTLYKPYYWDYFIDTQDELGKLSLVTSYTSSPSNVGTGSIIEIDQFYPYTVDTYQATASVVTGIGTLNQGGLGIKLDKTYQGSSLIEPGIWRNKMQWSVIKSWEHDVSYDTNDYVVYLDVVFKVLNGATVSNPLDNPFNLTSNYQIETNFTQFWNPNYAYSYGFGLTSSTLPLQYNWCWRYGEFYKNTNNTTYDFWNPTTSYNQNQIVQYYDRFFISVTYSSSSVPVGYNPSLNSGGLGQTQSFWKEVSSTYSLTSKWKPVSLWDKNKTYNSGNEFAIYDETLYHTEYSLVSTDDIPGQSNKWERIYSFVPDTTFNYGPTSNSIIQINDSYYYCKYNPQLTLDSGITIYINKKWKNVLVNIAINDNTIDSDKIIMDETKNTERDSLYVETNGRLTAANFIRQINDLDTLYGFADYTSYVIIEEDGTFKRFNFKNNLDDLPYLMICEEPDAFELKNDSLRYKINTVDKNVLKPSRYLVNGQLDNLEKIDFYNDLPLGVEIQNVKSDLPVLKNYNSQKSIIFEKYFRHSGYYMPIFYEVELFTNADLYDTGRLCEAQFVLDVQDQGVECPIVTWTYTFNGTNYLGFEDIYEVEVPLFYVGTFNGTYSYQGQLYTMPLTLTYNSFWQIKMNTSIDALLLIGTNSSMIGDYTNQEPILSNNISCQETQAWCISYTPNSTGQTIYRPMYVIKDFNTQNIVGYYISGEEYLLWNNLSSSWEMRIYDSLGGDCITPIPGIQTEVPIGTFPTACGIIIISDIKNCLSEWFPEGTQFQNGQTQVTLYFESGDLNSSTTISVASPTANTQEAYEVFYQQIIDAVQSQEIFSDKILSFEVYEPGNPSIHPQITGGYYVLSIKYDSPVCDLRLKAVGPSEATKKYCLTTNSKYFGFINAFATLENKRLGFLLQLIEGPITNGYPSYGAWVYYNNRINAFEIYYNPNTSRWEIYFNGTLQAYSNTFEGIFTMDNVSGSDSISEGNCNSVCVSVTFNEDIPVTLTGSFILVSDLYNGKNYYSGYLGSVPYLIKWETTPVAGWYLINPNPLAIPSHIGYVINTSQPIGTWIPYSAYYEISSTLNVCPPSGEVAQGLEVYGIPEWIWQP